MKEHIHRFRECAHGIDLYSGEEDWSFKCKEKNCLIYFEIYRNLAGKWNIEGSKGCQRCGWIPQNTTTSIMRQNRLRNHRRRAHDV